MSHVVAAVAGPLEVGWLPPSFENFHRRQPPSLKLPPAHEASADGMAVRGYGGQDGGQDAAPGAKSESTNSSMQF